MANREKVEVSPVPEHHTMMAHKCMMVKLHIFNNVARLLEVNGQLHNLAALLVL
jgi:hypothetical protein